MSTVTAEPEIDEPIPERSDYAKAKRHVFNRHLAHEAVMLDRMQRQLRQAERMEKFAATGKIEDLEAPEGEDDMGVSIGNENHWHIMQAPAPASTPAAVSPIATAAKGGLRRFVWPALLGAATTAAGAGGMALYQYFTDRPDSVTTITQPGGQFEYRYGIESRERTP